jgi:TetR/AcrR family transcriptional regulator, tetracycline repressor protein
MQTVFANEYTVPMGQMDVPSPPWAPQRRAQRLTREAIVETALAVLDRDGLDALSMRRVAAEMNTGAAALYRHVANKDELLDLLLDRVIGEIEVPPPDPERWTEQLKDVGRQARATMLGHRDVVRISMGRFPFGPNGLRVAEGLLAILRAGGLPDRLAATANHLITVVVNAFALEDVEPLGGPGATQEDVNALITGYVASLPPEQFPNLVALADEFAADDLDTRFELLMDIFVDGLAQRARS